MSDLVLLLVGSERETSRIEFGAHQVVIVRDEEAKAQIPEEFAIDRDWVMTVAESKGLEVRYIRQMVGICKWVFVFLTVLLSPSSRRHHSSV
jgi:hypothetical protein